jgi:ribosomal protein S14
MTSVLIELGWPAKQLSPKSCSECGASISRMAKAGLCRTCARRARPQTFDLSRYTEEDRGHSTPCWIWTGNVRADGYGQTHYKGKVSKPHRVFYTELVGPIPDGLTIDHLCRVKLCVNPAHMEAVSASENLRRQYCAGSGSPADLARRTACKHGHPFTPENTRIRSGGSRICRECNRLNVRRARGAA